MYRVDQFAVSAVIGGRDCGIWDKKAGGNTDSDEQKYHPGAMAEEISLGGQKTVENVTITRLFMPGRDDVLLPFLRQGAGKHECVITSQPLDEDKNPFGQAEVYNGKLKTVNPPDADSEGNAAALIELVISTAGTVG